MSSAVLAPPEPSTISQMERATALPDQSQRREKEQVDVSGSNTRISPSVSFCHLEQRDVRIMGEILDAIDDGTDAVRKALSIVGILLLYNASKTE